MGRVIRAVLEKSIPGRQKRKGQAPGMGMILSVQGPAREPSEERRNYFADVVRRQLAQHPPNPRKVFELNSK